MDFQKYFAPKYVNNLAALAFIDVNLLVGDMLGDIFKPTVEDFAKLVKGVGVDVGAFAKAVELPRAYVKFVY